MRLLVCGFFLTTALAAAPAPAPVQVPEEKSKTALCFRIVDNLNDKSLHDELNLTEEQRKRFASLPGEWERHRSETQSLRRLLPLSFDESHGLDLAVNRSVDKAMADLLQPAQFKRLQQIALRHLLLREGTAEKRNATPLLRKWPDLAEQLNLTEEQEKALDGKNARVLEDVLTDSQRNQWADLIGPPFKLPPVNAFDVSQRLRAAKSLESHRAFLYVMTNLRFPAVQQDLKLTTEQKKQLQSLDNEYFAVLGKFTLKTDTEQGQTLDATAKRLLAAIDKVLTPEQAKRYKQLRNQFYFPTRIRLSEPHPVPVNSSEILPGLDRGLGSDFVLTRAQQQQLKELDQKRVAAVRKVLGEDLAVSDIEKKINDLVAAADADMLAVLTDKQRNTFCDLAGAPYSGLVPLNPGSIFHPLHSLYELAGNVRQSLDGLYFSELAALSDEYMQAELALTAEQFKMISDRHEQWRKALFPWAEALFLKDRRKALETLSAYIEKQLTEVLRPEQLQRLRQFAMQERRVLGGRAAIAGYPGVAADLKLTQPQRDALCGGAEPAQILSAEQLKLLSRTCGQPFTFTIIERYLGRIVLDVPHDFGQPPLLRLLHEPALGDELPLKSEGRDRLDDLERYRRRLLRTFQDANRGEPDEQCRLLIEKALTRKLHESYSYEILGRLREIDRQLQSTPEKLGLASVLLQQEEIYNLELTEQQQAKLRRLRAENEKLRQLAAVNALPTLSWRGRPNPGEELDPNYQALMKTLGERQQAKVMALLTDKQKETWQKLLGKPFTAKERRFGRP